MLALTLGQPYATLARIGRKQWETRGWRRRTLPGTIAIHSAMAWTPEFRRLAQTHDYFKAALIGQDMPLGVILALVDITEIISTGEWVRRFIRRHMTATMESEYYFGDYSPGRYAWKMDNLRPIPEPIPCKGLQQLWQVPEHVLEAIEAQI